MPGKLLIINDCSKVRLLRADKPSPWVLNSIGYYLFQIDDGEGSLNLEEDELKEILVFKAIPNSLGNVESPEEIMARMMNRHLIKKSKSKPSEFEINLKLCLDKHKPILKHKNCEKESDYFDSMKNKRTISPSSVTDSLEKIRRHFKKKSSENVASKQIKYSPKNNEAGFDKENNQLQINKQKVRIND